MKIIFVGTTIFAAHILNKILDHGFNVPLVITTPDRPSGRGMKIHTNAVKKLSIEKNINILQPERLNDNQNVINALSVLEPDIIVVVAYGMLIPSQILVLPKIYAINIHASILPRWRGAAPIQRAIENGDKKSGISIIKLDSTLDTGDILITQECEILPSYTSLDLHNILLEIGAKLCIFVLNNIYNIKPYKQDIQNVTYAHKINKSEAKIIWNEENIYIVRKIKAFNPIPGAWTLLNNNILKIWNATVYNLSFNLQPGTLFIKDNLLLVACKNACVQLLEIQFSGKKRVLTEKFLQNRQIKIFTKNSILM